MRSASLARLRSLTSRIPARAVRAVAVFTLLAFGLTAAVPTPQAIPPGGGFPLPSSWFTTKDGVRWNAAAALVGMPKQRQAGTAAAKSHYVPASSTRARTGAGRSPGKGIGALPADVRTNPKVKRSTTPPIKGRDQFNPQTSRRIASAATATSDVYVNRDGSYTRKVHELPVNFRAADGTWKPIDRKLVPAGDRFRQQASGVDVSFAGSADSQQLASVRVEAGRALSYRLQGATKVAAVVSGDTVTYPEALPGVDVKLSATAVGVKESLVLKSADVEPSWVFPLQLQGLTPRLEAGGSVTLRDGDGEVAATIPAGYMEDSRFDKRSGGFATSWAVKYELTTVDGQPALRVTADEKWLRDPRRVYPVTLDPTTDLTTSGDTYVLNTSSTDKSGAADLQTGTWNGGGEKGYSFLHFNPFGSTYSGAKLSAVSLKIFDSWAYTCTPQPFTVNPVTAAWSDTGAKTYPGPAWGAAIGSLTADPGVACRNTSGDRSVGTWMSVPLSLPTFQNWALGGANNGLAVTASQTISEQWKRFTSSNGPCCAPYLQVTYAPNVPPQVDSQYPAHGGAVTSLTPELMAAAHDPDAHPKPLLYNFVVFNKAGTKIADSGFISARNWVVPASAGLKWGETYTWTVVATDTLVGSSSQTMNTFSTPVPQPVITSGLSQNGGPGFDPAAGNYTTSATDANISTVGPALTIQRSYNSSHPGGDRSAFGDGWSSILDMTASEGSTSGSTVNDSVVIRYPTGQEIAFGKNKDGTYAPPPGRFATLTPVTGGGYRLVDKDGTTYTFTSKARATLGVWSLVTVADSAGRTLTFTYTGGDGQSVEGFATTITSASGRKLYLTWSEAGASKVAHVLSIKTDPAVPGDASTAATWTYKYKPHPQYGYDTNELIAVCPPTSTTACTTYTYTDGSQGYGATMNAGPQSYWRLGEASGTTAASAVADNQGTDNATYTNVTLGQPGPNVWSTAKAAGFNGTSSRVQLPSKLGASATQQSISMWFKANAGDKGVLFSFQADPITKTTTPGNYTPALYIGTSGKLYGEFWHGSAAPIVTSSAVNDGTWHHVVLAGAGATQTMYLDGWTVGSKAGTITNANSGVNYYVGTGFLGGAWPDQPHYTTANWTGYPTYFKGSVADVAFFDRPLSEANASAVRWGGFRHVRSLTSVVRPSGNASSTVAYDGASGTVKQVTDSNGGVWKLNPATVAGSTLTHASTVLGANPADYWRLAEGGTVDAVNEVRGGAATYNSVALGVAGGPFDDPAREDDNTAVAGFNGTSSYLELPDADIPATGANSISMWFKTPPGSISGGTLFGYQTNPVTAANPAANSWVPALYVGADGKLRGEIWHGAVAPITSGSAVNDGAWHHAVLAAGATAQTLYLDGEAVGTTEKAPVATSAAYAYVGAGETTNWPSAPTNPRGYFAGQIAEVAYYKSQLSAGHAATQFAARSKSSGVPVKTVSVTDPGDKTVKYLYDVASGRKIGDVDALGNTTRYGYDVGGFLRTVTDPNGALTTTEQDVRGNTVSSTTCQDRAANRCSTVYYTYFPDATTKFLTPDPRNDLLLTERDGRSASATDNTYLTTHAYDAKGNRTSVTDPLGRVTATAYTNGTSDAAFDTGFAPAGLPKTLTTAGGAVQSVVYFRNGDVAKVTDPAGKVTTFTYDALGRALTKKEVTDTFPAGVTGSATYDRLGRVVTQTGPGVTNRVTGAVHTALATTVYDVDGLVTSETVADKTGGDAARAVATTYDVHGKPATKTDPDGRKTELTYDPYGNVTQETEADGGVTRTTYDAEGRLLTSVLVGWTGDPNNPSPAADLVLSSRTYDPAGRLASETDAMGWVTSFTYTDNGLTAKTTRQDPATSDSFVLEETGYDAAGNVVSQIINDGATKSVHVVDAASRITSSTLDPAGLNRTTTQVYSPDDHVLTTTQSGPTGTVAEVDATYDPLGRMKTQSIHNDSGLLTTVWVLDKGGLPTSMTDPKGNTTNYSYDEAGRLAVTTEPAVTTEVGGGAPVLTRPVSYTGYDTFGAPTESKDPGGNTTVTTYDAAGRDVATQLPAYTPPGSSTPLTPVARKTYDKLGQVETSVDPLGATTKYLYDQLGRVAKVTAPNLGETKATYDLLGDQLSVVDPSGAMSTATYDYLGRKLTSTDVVRQDGANYTTHFTYGPGGWLESVKSPAGVQSRTTYNAAGETATVADGAGNVTRLAYDGAGRSVKMTLPDGTYSTTAYDLAGRTTATKAFDAAGTQLSSEASAYDANGNLTASTDARGTTTTFGYDSTGVLTSQVEPVSATDSITTTFGYDVAGNRTRFTDGRGNVFRSTYNSWDLPESLIEPATTAYPDPADRTFTVSYDAAGRATSQLAPGGVRVTNTYDVMGNLTKQVGEGAEVDTADRAFDYDVAGRMTSATGSAGANTFGYDDRGLLVSASGVSGASSFTYNSDGSMTSRVDAAATTNYTYDSAGRLATVSNQANGVQLALAYNSLAQVKSIAYGQDANTRTFGYDDLHRLTADELKTAAGESVAKIAYGYDPNGNETSKTTTGFGGTATNTYTYDLADRLTSWDNGTTTTDYAYDKSGNRTRAGDKTFSYDERNQLTTSGTTSYQYSARGTLTSTVTQSGSAGTRVDAFGQVVRQDTASGQQSYSYDGLGRVLRSGFAYSGMGNSLASDGTATYTRDADDDLLGVASGGQKRYAWTDLHNDVVGQFAADGTALEGSTTFDPLGKVLASSQMIGSLGYQSEWTDNATGRVNMLARWYNTETGQFDTRDSASLSPVPDSLEANRFVYASDNPLTVTDPTGHWSLSGLGKSIKKGINKATKRVSSAYRSVSNKVTSTYRAAAAKVTSTYRAVTKKVSNAYHNTKRWVNKKIDQGRKYVSQKYHKAKAAAKKQWNKVKQAGKRVVAKTVRVVKHAAAKVKDAYNATTKWVKEHQDLLIEIAAIGAAIAAGLACTAVTAGAGAVACMVVAGALINLAKDYSQGDIHDAGDAFGSLAVGAVSGLAGGVGGMIGSKAAGFAVSAFGDVAGTIGGRSFAGAVSGGVGDAVSQFATTGRVDLSGVAMSAGIGAAFGGFYRGGAKGGSRGDDARPARSGDRDGASCPIRHSFDPKTPVVMADGSRKPIKDVRVGEKVAATDPKTGLTAAKPVTALHRNVDKELTDVTVTVRKPGKPGERRSTTTVLRTTKHHPFWDRTIGAWVLAAALVVGHQFAATGGSVVTVTSVRNHVGAAEMRDLTVVETHTYYVLAGDTPVLVHNCGPNDPKVRGAMGEAATRDRLVAAGHTQIQSEVTFDTVGGVRFRADFVSRTKDGRLVMTESKHGPGADLTDHQRIGYPEATGRGVIPRGDNAAAAGLPVGRVTRFDSVDIDLWE